jgi:hypothetical protein
MENFDPFFLFQDNDDRGIKGTLSDSNPLAKKILKKKKKTVG